ncbi:MAG: hypothetical protein K2K35_06515, partial [Lachnospiraceae bacterium]|nr:hypothetical protein [Lachnospiraceae bacterium]
FILYQHVINPEYILITCGIQKSHHRDIPYGGINHLLKKVMVLAVHFVAEPTTNSIIPYS